MAEERYMMGKTPAGVKFLLIATIASFVLEMYAGENAIAGLALWPLQAGFMPWQVVSYAFLHANTFHLAVNMYGLWMFGSEMERLLGRRTFLQLYAASVLSAAVMQLLVMSADSTGRCNRLAE